ncbi:MAG: hypothetical protein JJV98_03210 [Desulfosarcina sp.]|nr:hypothetical protein [Desulfobacterales bacterium]
MADDVTPAKSSQSDDPNGFQVQSPSISLPKGGGAIRGIGEKFAANPGTGTMTIAVSPGRSGFGPQLSLSYDSGAGNGPFGFGWSLSLPAIVTQRRNLKDTQLKHQGENVAKWLPMAQAFAGGLQEPPLPGIRVVDYKANKFVDSVHPEMVDFGSGQGPSDFETTGVARLRRGFQKSENAGRG